MPFRLPPVPRRVILALLLSTGSMPLLAACETEQDRVRDLLEALSQELPQRPGETKTARSSRIRAALRPALSRDVQVKVPWLEGPGDATFALNAATGVVDAFPIGDLDLEDVAVRLSASERRAHVTGTARVSGSQPGDLHAFDVPFEVDLRKHASAWRVERLAIEEPRRGLPEARP